MFDKMEQVLDKAVKEYWPQNGALGNTLYCIASKAFDRSIRIPATTFPSSRDFLHVSVNFIKT